MKAMVLQSPESLVQEEIENPTIEAGNTLIKITHSGVCGTDLKIYQGGIPVDYPRVMGHEMIGVERADFVLEGSIDLSAVGEVLHLDHTGHRGKPLSDRPHHYSWGDAPDRHE